MDDVNGVTVKKFKAGDAVPVNATKEVYASLFAPRRSLIPERLTLAGHSLSAGTDLISLVFFVVALNKLIYQSAFVTSTLDNCHVSLLLFRNWHNHVCIHCSKTGKLLYHQLEL